MFLSRQRVANVWLIWPLATGKMQTVQWLISFVNGHIVIAKRPSVCFFFACIGHFKRCHQATQKVLFGHLGRVCPSSRGFGSWTAAAQGLCPCACVSGRRTSCRRHLANVSLVHTLEDEFIHINLDKFNLLPSSGDNVVQINVAFDIHLPITGCGLFNGR